MQTFYVETQLFKMLLELQALSAIAKVNDGKLFFIGNFLENMIKN